MRSRVLFDRYIDLLGATDALELIESAFRRRAFDFQLCLFDERLCRRIVWVQRGCLSLQPLVVVGNAIQRLGKPLQRHVLFTHYAQQRLGRILGNARELLRQATQAQIAAAQQAYQIQDQARAAGDAQMLGAAQSTAAEADVAMTERRYLEAAELFGQAVNYVPSGHANEKGGYLLSQADALFEQGDQRVNELGLLRKIDPISGVSGP